MTGSTDFEAEYNNRARVANHPEIIDGWQENAAAWRAQMISSDRCKPGISYGADPRQTIDLFLPETDRNGPIALFIHGGYWQAMAGNMFSHLARGLCEHEIPVAVMSYRLCPHVKVADIIDDARSAVLALWTLHQRQVMPIGHSAGGHLAACLLATEWQKLDPNLPESLVPAATAFSGLFDLDPIRHTSINETIGLTETSAWEASPLYWPVTSSVWFEAFVGSDESTEYHRQSDEIVAAWDKFGGHVQKKVVPNANHFNIINGLADPDSEETIRLAVLAHSLE